MSALLCILHPVGCVPTSIAKATLGDLFTALTSWVLSSVQWLLSAAGTVLTSAAEPTTVVTGATQEFNVLLVLSPILMMIGLLVSTLQALRHGDTASLGEFNRLSQHPMTMEVFSGSSTASSGSGKATEDEITGTSPHESRSRKVVLDRDRQGRDTRRSRHRGWHVATGRATLVP